MSYTAPEYVDTRAQAILVLASTIADEDKTGIGNCSVRTALDVLADTLADSDVTIPETDAGEILALAQYVSGGGGGGGGVTLGALGVTFFSADTPVVGEYVTPLPFVNTAKIGDSTVSAALGDGFQPGLPFAAGVTFEGSGWSDVTPAAYVCAVDGDEGTYSSVSPWDGEINVSGEGVLSFVLPELADGTVLVFTTAV